MSFCFRTPKLGVPKFLKWGFLQLWRPITLCANLWLKWSLKHSCSPHQEFSKNMWHTTYMQGNQGNSRFLMVRNQIGNLTPDPSFGHNFNPPNASCELILDIYISRSFQWYEKLFNPMIFNLCNCSLKIRQSIGSIKTLTPKVEVHLGVCGFILSHFPTFPRAWNVTPKLHSWPAPLQTLALVMSPNLGS
jgi:hypothetical protein